MSKFSYIESDNSEGATMAAGGSPVPSLADAYKNGYFINPTIFTEVKDSMRICHEEIFGPAVVVAFSSEEAIQCANDTTSGLGTAVFTRDLERAHRVAAEIEAGIGWVNSSQDCDPRIPFGGVKQSGIGGELGEAGLEVYTQIKAVHCNIAVNI
ncbi:aldehyde dehydrogenase [Paecilomyces variotii No. 5]|uniref:Aldehyde dehydrogenase n=1 Tax=Byssochlamys spectabilis (strain No. 5 / NBRC 109023) TaxID=1356009 RepID=V5FVB2_BYSSN|nr:aldehyde dehydrogenase [Paecilomyces variotii No. 5]